MSTLPQYLNVIMVIALTFLSGYADSRGFIYASKMWQDGHLVMAAFLRSALGFSVGITTYWFAVRYLQPLGVKSAELQTVGWFAVAIIGVALTSGEFIKWSVAEQLTGFIIVAGTAWLMYSTSS